MQPAFDKIINSEIQIQKDDQVTSVNLKSDIGQDDTVGGSDYDNPISYSAVYILNAQMGR